MFTLATVLKKSDDGTEPLQLHRQLEFNLGMLIV